MIGPFKGDYTFLSNFAVAPVCFRGIWYSTNEHWYQSSKARTQTQKMRIIEAPTAAEAKRRGREVGLVTDFDKDKLYVMHFGLLLKFGQHPDLAQRLIATGDEDLVEVNTWDDTYWGMCLENGQLVGENHLGKLLMTVRKTLK